MTFGEQLIDRRGEQRFDKGLTTGKNNTQKALTKF